MASRRSALAPRDLHSAARAGAAFAWVGALLLTALTLTVPSFAPGPAGRWSTLGLAAVLVLLGVVVTRWPTRLPTAYWATVPTQVIAATLYLDLTTRDATAAGQAFLIWPVLYAAYELRPWAAAASLVQALAAEAVIVFTLLPPDRAVTDLVCVGATLTVLCWVLVRARERQARLVGKLERRAAVDPLTGLATRRVFDEVMRSALEAERHGQTTLLLIDVDHFKSVNDELGHPAGDAVLVHVASLLRETFPEPAVVARLGGDELAVLMTGATVAEAGERAQHFRHSLGAHPPTVAGAVRRVSVSIGAAAAVGPAVRDLYARADEALYGAKRAGRDRVCTLGAQVAGGDGPGSMEVHPAADGTGGSLATARADGGTQEPSDARTG
jgi:diguanylate cyclase (GGDEF)-like protein